MRVVDTAPATARLVTFELEIDGPDEAAARVSVSVDPPRSLFRPFVDAVSAASIEDPGVVERVAALGPGEIAVTIDAVERVGGRFRLKLTAYPLDRP